MKSAHTKKMELGMKHLFQLEESILIRGGSWRQKLKVWSLFSEKFQRNWIFFQGFEPLLKDLNLVPMIWIAFQRFKRPFKDLFPMKFLNLFSWTQNSFYIKIQQSNFELHPQPKKSQVLIKFLPQIHTIFFSSFKIKKFAILYITKMCLWLKLFVVLRTFLHKFFN